MKNVACLNGCLLVSLKEVLNEHSGMILLGAVGGAVLALFGESVAWVVVGAGSGMLLAFLYGWVPRGVDCVDKCPGT